MPGSAYHYSGGEYEIAEALMADTLHTPFLEGMDALVLKPAEMTHSTFAQPLPSELARVAAKGHYGDGNQLPGGWRICPEHAAGDCGPHRQTSPISCSWLPAHGVAKAGCSYPQRQRGRC